MKRQPAVAGQFYGGTSPALSHQVSTYIIEGRQKEKVIAVLCPHAGLMYSGHVAGAVYSSIQIPDTFVLLGPNHTGLGSPVSMMASGQWEIPTGSFSIDEDLSRKLLLKAPRISEDTKAHLFEHSLEVQLPFIAHFSTKVKIVPITLMMATLEACEEIGHSVAETIKEADYNIVIVASTDMSHYVTDERARKLDGLAIQEVLNLHPHGLYNTVQKEGISMCGFIPATIMLFAAKELGAKQARLIKYATSGEVSGDYDHVVGYAGVVIT